MEELQPGSKLANFSQELKSCMCTQEMLESDLFRAWTQEIRHDFRMHRKIWEFCYIAQALFERGFIKAGSRGLGFAVGQEPLPALFAKNGCKIVATDLAIDQARDKGWVDSNQHASALDDLNRMKICPEDLFRENVSFQPVDMIKIPAELTGFDFIWSSCSLEHLGSIAQGICFINNSLRCLRPGGVAVHTTEFNCSSNETTIENGPSVLFRQKDFEIIADILRFQGHEIELDFSPGKKPLDLYVDKPPYTLDKHIKLEFEGYASTSFGLIIRKAAQTNPATYIVETLLDLTTKERDGFQLELNRVLASRSQRIIAPMRAIWKWIRVWRNRITPKI